MPGKTAEQILALANEHGEIGYAYPPADAPRDENDDYPGIEKARFNGWIEFWRDDTVNDPLSSAYRQRRDLFRITDAGRAKLAELKAAPSNPQK